MDLLIPGKVQIGARTFRLRMNEQILSEIGCKAQLVDKEDLIRMSYRSKLSMWESLVHEIMHEAYYLCGDGDKEEGKVQAVASFLAQGLASLGINPDFSNIPEEEK